jgi:predicted TPR repeat methyltransferase
MTKTSENTSYFNVKRIEVLELIPKQCRRFLDIGCGTGATMQLIRERIPSAEITGVEINKSIRLPSSEKVISGDVNDQNIRNILVNNSPYDCILMLDILEHLVDPWETLNFIKSLLCKEGVIILSIPNIANLKVIAPLVFWDDFKYSEAGILDKTHLRFFTQKSGINLVESAGLIVSRIQSTGPSKISQIKSPAGVAAYILSTVTLRLFERFIAHQYLIVAKRH